MKWFLVGLTLWMLLLLAGWVILDNSLSFTEPMERTDRNGRRPRTYNR